jgi:hypothetical protein
MERFRCPYCVEGNGFKVMTPRDGDFVCLQCGHVVVPDILIHVCICQKCIELGRVIAIQSSPASGTPANDRSVFLTGFDWAWYLRATKSLVRPVRDRFGRVSYVGR